MVLNPQKICILKFKLEKKCYLDLDLSKLNFDKQVTHYNFGKIINK